MWGMDYYFGDGFADPAGWSDDPDVALGGGPANGVLVDFTGDGVRDDVMWDSTGDGVADHVVLAYDSGDPRVYADLDGSGLWADYVGGGADFDFSVSEPASVPEPADVAGHAVELPPGQSPTQSNVAEPPELGNLSGRWGDLPEWVRPDLSVLPTERAEGEAEAEQEALAADIGSQPQTMAEQPIEPDQVRDEPAEPEPSGPESAEPELAEPGPGPFDLDEMPPEVAAPVSEPGAVEGPRPFAAPAVELTPEPPVQAGTQPAAGGVDERTPPVVGADGSVTVDSDGDPVILRDTDGDGYLDSVDSAESADAARPVGE